MNTHWGKHNTRYRAGKKRKAEEVTEDEKPLDLGLEDLPIFGMGGNNNETIFKKGNHLYFYDDVTTLNNLKFTRLLRDLDREQQVQLLRGEITEPTIHIHINSPGGSLLDGFSMASSVLACKSKTVAYAEAIVASAATLPLVCCNERHIQKYCYVLIHQLSSGFWGTYENFLDEQTNLDNLMDQLCDLYHEHTKVPKKKLRGILKHDLYWNAETCIKYSVVDDMC